MTWFELLSNDWSPMLLGWLLTYAVHGALLGGGAWLVCKVWRTAPLDLKDGLWKAAMAGGLVTVSLQAAWGAGPFTTHLPAAMTPVEVLSRIQEFNVAAAHSVHVDPAGAPPVEEATGPGSGPMSWLEALTWPFLAIMAWLAWSSRRWFGFVSRRRRLARALMGRVPITAGPLWEMTAALQKKAGLRRPVKLSTSSRIQGPIALRGEICVPERTLTALKPQEQRAALAHELAHVLRRDPFWLDVSGVLEALFFFSPVQRAARKQWQKNAEFLCDDWSVRHTGCGLDLASGLMAVASWIKGQPERVPAVAMASPRSPLTERVSRILAHDGPVARQPAGPLRRLAPLALLGLIALTGPSLMLAGGLGDEVDESRSLSISAEVIDVGQDRYRVRVRYWERLPERAVKFLAKGALGLNQDETDIAYLSPGGSLTLEEIVDGSRRMARLSGRGQKPPELRYSVDGEEQAVDETARQFYRRMLDEFIREVNINAAKRGRRILEQEGTDALIAEWGRTRNKNVRKTYARILGEAGVDPESY